MPFLWNWTRYRHRGYPMRHPLLCSLRGRIRKLRFGIFFMDFIRKLRLAMGFLSGFTRGEYHIALVDFIFSSRGRIRKLRYAFVVCFAFFNEEYLIASVDFIVALRRTKGRGRRTLRSPPSPSSGLHLIHPGVIRCGGALWLPRAWDNLGSCIPVLSLHPSSECCFVICVRAMVVRVSVGLLGEYRSFFIIGGIDCLFLRLRGGFAIIFRWICANRGWIISFG